MSPDLELRLLVDDLDWPRAESIARSTWQDGAVPVGTGPHRQFFRSQPPRLGSWDVHDLLAETADWNAETWDMQPDKLSLLVGTFEILFREIPEPFAVEITWAGDDISEERHVSRPDMLDIVRKGAIGTHTRYCIAGA